MSARVFFDPDNVARLAARGITGRARQLSARVSAVLVETEVHVPSSAAPARGFVLRRSGEPRIPVTHVVDVRGPVTITGSRPLLSGSSTRDTVPGTTTTEPRTALELIEDCRQLRSENDRLRRDNQRLAAEVARLSTAAAAPLPPSLLEQDLDDTARRFALLELD